MESCRPKGSVWTTSEPVQTYQAHDFVLANHNSSASVVSRSMDSLKESTQLVSVLFFLLPGLLTSKVVEMLARTRTKDGFDRVVEAFVFTFINLLLFSLLRRLLFKPPFNQDFYSPGNLLLLLFCSLGIGMACAHEIKNETLLRVLRKARITKRTYKSGTWSDSFHTMEKYVVVHLTDGRRIYGWPRFFSSDSRERALYLENASWLGPENQLLNQIPIEVYLDDKSGIQLIEYVTPQNGASRPE